MPDTASLIAILTSLVALLALWSHRALRARHSRLKHTLNRVARERDEARWQLGCMAGRADHRQPQ